jgi:lipoyl-dependent peroxiredoxin
MAKRTAQAGWTGSFKEGSGTMAFGSGAFEGRYTAASRFEEGDGTNPEELIAAAHAGCFSMALTLDLNEAGHEPESVTTEADVHLTPASGGGFEISRIDLRTRGVVPGIDQDAFRDAAEATKLGCPVSKALAAVPEITLDAQLVDA